MRRTPIAALAALALLAAPTAAGAASLLDVQGDCIHRPPSSGWITRTHAGDGFVVHAPASQAAAATEAEQVIRTKSVLPFYEARLSISGLGTPAQAGAPYPVYLDPELPSADPSADGVTSKVCEAPAESAVVVRTDIHGVEFHATLVHELFHAAQTRAAGGFFADDWWYEATATYAETLFGFGADSHAFDRDLTDHPSQRMDLFRDVSDGVQAHEYGAWLFASWLVHRKAMTWPRMRHTFALGQGGDTTAALHQVIDAGDETLGEEVASFWGDHLKPKPVDGPTGHLTRVDVGPGTSVDDFPAPVLLGARLLAIHPTSGVQQLVVKVAKVPAHTVVEIWRGDDGVERLGPGDSTVDTYCRTGATPGSYELPASGDVRIAIVTTDGSPGPDVRITSIGERTKCPPQLVIVPGIGVGPLHLGMTVAQASAASRSHRLGAARPSPWGSLRFGTFTLRPRAVVSAFVLDGRLAVLAVSESFAFRTTTHVTTLEPGVPFPDVGSTIGEFSGRHPGPCHAYSGGGDGPPTRVCFSEGPRTRWTMGIGAHVSCEKQDFCTNPEGLPIGPDPGYYVSNLGVATAKGHRLLQAAYGG